MAPFPGCPARSELWETHTRTCIAKDTPLPACVSVCTGNCSWSRAAVSGNTTKPSWGWGIWGQCLCPRSRHCPCHGLWTLCRSCPGTGVWPESPGTVVWGCATSLWHLGSHLWIRGNSASGALGCFCPGAVSILTGTVFAPLCTRRAER